MSTRTQIAAAVQRLTGVEWVSIVGPSRAAAVVHARDLCIGLARRMRCDGYSSIASYPDIAEWLRRRSHTTVMDAHRRVEAEHCAVLDRLQAELEQADDSDEKAVAEVLRRPDATRLMIDRLRPLMAAEERRA